MYKPSSSRLLERRAEAISAAMAGGDRAGARGVSGHRVASRVDLMRGSGRGLTRHVRGTPAHKADPGARADDR